MKCANCGASAFDRMLRRVNPIGENGIFWCMPCIQDTEPELAKNIKDDKTEVEKAIEDICLKPESNKPARSMDLTNTTPIKRLKKMILKFETKVEMDAWWLGYCNGGCWPQSVWFLGVEIIREHFK